jgi:hypothetical protein
MFYTRDLAYEKESRPELSHNHTVTGTMYLGMEEYILHKIICYIVLLILGLFKSKLNKF